MLGEKFNDVLAKHVVTVGRSNAEAEHDGQCGSDALGFLEGNAGVVGIEDSLDKQEVDAAVAQGFNLFGVGGAEVGLG